MDNGLTAGARPRCNPLIPSFFQVLDSTSTALVYTLGPPPFASSPWSWRRVLATSAGLDIVTAMHAATPPQANASAVWRGFDVTAIRGGEETPSAVGGVCVMEEHKERGTLLSLSAPDYDLVQTQHSDAAYKECNSSRYLGLIGPSYS